MEKIRTVSELKNAIKQLEYEQSVQLLLLKEEFHIVCEKLKPVNIIKDTLKDSVPDIKTSITNSFLGVASGLLTRKIILGKTNNPITRTLGLILEKFVSSKVAKNADRIKSFAGTVLEKITNTHD
jgi:hypothetical protein